VTLGPCLLRKNSCRTDLVPQKGRRLPNHVECIHTFIMHRSSIYSYENAILNLTYLKSRMVYEINEELGLSWI
jgi:hypothetical protein